MVTFSASCDDGYLIFFSISLMGIEYKVIEENILFSYNSSLILTHQAQGTEKVVRLKRAFRDPKQIVFALYSHEFYSCTGFLQCVLLGDTIV